MRKMSAKLNNLRFFAAALAVAILIALLAAPAKAQSTQYRVVTISSQPDSTVWVDGVQYGKTDKSGTLQIKTIAPGMHTLRIRADGFKERSQPLAATQRGELSILLTKTTDEAEVAFQDGERLTTQDREKSADAYRKAIKLRPNYPEAYVGLARVLLDAGNTNEAKTAILQARRLRPIYPEATAVEGRIHKENGDEAKAIAAFKRAITDGHGFQPEAYAGLGILYKEKAENSAGTGDYDAETTNYDEATKYLRSALKQLSGAPDAIVIYQLFGLIFERQKKYADAIVTYEEFLRIFPDVPEATAVRSFILQIRKNQVSQ
jgi:tetratricopeptide (TPR) repeat protein